MGLTGRGRRDPLHRLRCAEEDRAGARAGWSCAASPTSTRGQAAGQDALFDLWRFHAFFTTVPTDIMDTVAADKTHRGHAVIEQVHADLKNSALAHLPSGKFTANGAWLVLAVIAFNLTRAAATITGPDLAKATTATIRRKLITSRPGSPPRARRITLHLPAGWPWETAHGPTVHPRPRPAATGRDDLTTQPPPRRDPGHQWNTLTARSGRRLRHDHRP